MDEENSSNDVSEMKANYHYQILPTEVITGRERLTDFWTRELYTAHNYYKKQSLDPPDIPPASSEYKDAFFKDMKGLKDHNPKTRHYEYDLYDSTPITLWNPAGDSLRSFRRKYLITRPLNECAEKFGP